jgi:type VI protein secretion system component Hcp
MSEKTVLAKLKFNLKKCIIIAMHAAVLGSGGKMVDQLRLNFESIDQEH